MTRVFAAITISLDGYITWSERRSGARRRELPRRSGCFGNEVGTDTCNKAVSDVVRRRR
jgi:hypothetical protein